MLAVLILAVPGNVSNVTALDDSLMSAGKFALEKSFSVPEVRNSGLTDIVASVFLSPSISMLSYRQGDSPYDDVSGTPDNDEKNADTSTDKYSDITEYDATALHSGSPKVLIYHTHTTEAYVTKAGEKPSSWRSTDPSKNLLSVGSIVSQVLHDEYGIEVLHITEIFDQPYDSAYDKSYDAAKAAVEKYPTIEYIFDIHRDGLSNTEENREVYLTNINGQDCARVMFVMSTKSKYIDEMRAFGAKVQSKLNELYPGVFRRNMDRPYRYNLEFVPNSMLFEVGSNLTTIAEAKSAAVYLGRSIGEVITDDMAE